jgi:hypothetical protein
MANDVSIELNLGPLDRLIGVIPARAAAILDKAAFDVERIAKPLTAYDTGAMRNSIYVSGASGGSSTGYGSAASEAESRRPGVGLVPQVVAANKFERVVGVAVEYAYWQELQNPYLTPAVEQVRPQVNSAWRQLFV